MFHAQTQHQDTSIAAKLSVTRMSDGNFETGVEADHHTPSRVVLGSVETVQYRGIKILRWLFLQL